MSDAITLTKQAITNAIAPSAGSASAAIAVSLVDLDWQSIAIAVSVAGAVALVSAAERFERTGREDVGIRVWLMEFGVGACAGLLVWGAASLGHFDTRTQIAMIAASGWSGRPVLNGALWLWERVKGAP